MLVHTLVFIVICNFDVIFKNNKRYKLNQPFNMLGVLADSKSIFIPNLAPLTTEYVHIIF